MSSNKPLGIILYEGESLLDGERIMVIATGVFSNKSENRKVGAMIQTWIMRRDVPPILAKRLGLDYSICGNCKHRDFDSCYVNLCHGPMHIYNAYHDNRYIRCSPALSHSSFSNKSIRIGSYGDPAAVPTEIWSGLCFWAKDWTGYTHQWKNCDQSLKDYCMASVDSKKEYCEAQLMGWRTFRIRQENEALLTNEFVCLASKEGGKKTDCAKCNGCGGLSSKISKSPSIVIHGPNFKVDNFVAGMKKIKNKKKWRIDFETRYEELKQLA